MRTDPGEMFDVVDENDRVLRQERRDIVHRNNLLHRAVHVWLFDGESRLLLQMRSAEKDQYPSTWTSSASGHLDAGESYSAAAPRELHEELGVRTTLRESIHLPGSPDTAFEFTRLFTGEYNGPIAPAEDEVADLRWWEIPTLRTEVERSPDRFSPPLIALVRKYDFAGMR